MKREILGAVVGWNQRTARLVAVGVAIALAACASRTAPPPAPSVQRYPDFVYPSVPTALQRAPGAERIEVAWRYLQSGDTRTAGREFAAALRSTPELYPARAGEAYVALARGDQDHALTAFEVALKPAPQYVPALIGRGQALVALKRDDEAIASFEAALAVDSSLAAVRRQVEVLRFRSLEQVIGAGRSAEAAGRLDQARTAYERAISLSPESSFLYRELANVERRQGDAERALQHYTRAIELDPMDAASLAGMGDVLLVRQDFQAAETAYRRAAAIEPSPELSGKLAALAVRTRDLKLPVEFRAIAAAPEITRGDLAALVALRLDRVLASATQRQVVTTDTAGHWASAWIAQVASAGVMEPFENHTFQPRLTVRRGDLADVVSRLVRLLATSNPALRARIASLPPIADMSSSHLRYPAAAVAVASGVMPLVDGDRFDVNGPVTGADAQDVVGRLQALSR